MSLLIKGLDMPKLDENEEHLWVPGWIEVGKDGKAIFCTGTHFDPNTIHSYAVEELPTPHGRLIDADALQAEADSQPCFWKGVIDEPMVREAPTIIEAEVNQVEFDYQDDRIINDEHTIAEPPQEEYIKKLEQMEVPHRPHPFDIK